MSSAESAVCFGCGHDRRLHHSYGCDGNLGAEQSFWSAFEELPGYDQTREAIAAQELGAPRPCSCTAHTFKA
ncbi:MAG TPA: hypothetical protein VME66_07360 [Candidatus Acidoferrales bacterium]|nr:hypothetical protein [Candidatus Acidoferrales bacterium]